jgi:predicted phage tail component-like protein
LITFNGISSTAYSDIVSVQNVKRMLSPATRSQTLEIVGRDGAYYFGKDNNSQTVSFRLALNSTSIADRRAAIRQIAYWLDTEDMEILSFTDEPDLMYYAVLADPIPVDEFATIGLADVSFFVPEGYAHDVNYFTRGLPDFDYIRESVAYNRLGVLVAAYLPVFEDVARGLPNFDYVRESVAYNNSGILVVANWPVYENIPDLNSGTLATPVEMLIIMEADSATGVKVSLDTDNYIEIETALSANDRIFISTNSRTITINGVDAQEYMTIESKYFSVPVGDFTLTTDPIDALIASVTFRQRYI